MSLRLFIHSVTTLVVATLSVAVNAAGFAPSAWPQTTSSIRLAQNEGCPYFEDIARQCYEAVKALGEAAGDKVDTAKACLKQHCEILDALDCRMHTDYCQ